MLYLEIWHMDDSAAKIITNIFQRYKNKVECQALVDLLPSSESDNEEEKGGGRCILPSSESDEEEQGGCRYLNAQTH
jgi:hypothetical protein